MDKTMQGTVTLNNGVEMPYFGLGVYLAGSGKETENAVTAALKRGYRHIDTAAMYKNEEDVGRAVAGSGIPRKDIFITTKLWNSDHGFDRAQKALDKSLSRLKMDYVDLYLIHWPVEEKRRESWKALVKMQEEGKCRAIGVSNYTIRHLRQLLTESPVVPAVNQVEFSPFLYQKDLLEFCRENGIQPEAYSPLTRGKKLDHKTLVSLGEKYGKSPAQIMIRWALQHDIVVIPKSVHEKRIEENAQVFDFTISPDDMQQLDSLNQNFRVAWDPSEIK